MNRREFLSKLGQGAGALVAGSFGLSGCASREPYGQPETNLYGYVTGDEPIEQSPTGRQLGPNEFVLFMTADRYSGEQDRTYYSGQRNDDFFLGLRPGSFRENIRIIPFYNHKNELNAYYMLGQDQQSLYGNAFNWFGSEVGFVGILITDPAIINVLIQREQAVEFIQNKIDVTESLMAQGVNQAVTDLWVSRGVPEIVPDIMVNFSAGRPFDPVRDAGRPNIYADPNRDILAYLGPIQAFKIRMKLRLIEDPREASNLMLASYNTYVYGVNEAAKQGRVPGRVNSQRIPPLVVPIPQR